MKTLLSIFDYSGNWSYPFACNGWNVIQWDIKIADFMDINSIEDVEIALDLFEDVDGIIAAPPCTDFSVSGAQYWSVKDEDGRTWSSMQMVDQVLKLVSLFTPTDPDYEGTFFWAMENPVGRLNKLYPELPKPVYFHPYEFAGHLNPSASTLLELDAIRAKGGLNLTDAEVQLIWDSNTYTKKTGLWGDFNSNLIKLPIEPCKGSAQGSPLQRLGGKSDKTKELRSNCPMGFAQAFYEANKDYVGTWKQRLADEF